MDRSSDCKGNSNYCCILCSTSGLHLLIHCRNLLKFEFILIQVDLTLELLEDLLGVIHVYYLLSIF